MYQEKPSRNGFIDIQKFFYAWIVVIRHFYTYTREHLKGGGSTVEFFLIVSGAFFFASYKKRTEEMGIGERLNYPVKFIRRRLLRFLPYTVPTFVLGFIVKAVITKDGMGINGIVNIMDSFIRNIWDIPLITMSGLNGGKSMINGVVWTISAMLIVEFVILNFLVRKEKLFCSFLAPVAILMGFGLWAQLDDTDHFLWRGFTTFGVIRTFIMTAIGIYAWKASKWLSRVNFTKSGRMTLTIIELSLHIFAVISMAYRSGRYHRILLAAVFAVAIVITLSQRSYSMQWFRQSTITNFLGEWSMTIYLTHFPIKDWLYKYFESPYDFYKMKYVYGILVILVSLALLYFARWIIRVAPKVTAKMRSVLVDEGTNPKAQI